MQTYKNMPVRQSGIDDSTCTKETLLLDNAHYQQMCETWGYPCILIDQAYEVDIPL